MVYRATIPLKFQIYSMYRFYGSLNEKNWIWELCMFSHIWSHNYDVLLYIVDAFNDLITKYTLPL